jgi:hypothetical protein
VPGTAAGRGRRTALRVVDRVRRFGATARFVLTRLPARFAAGAARALFFFAGARRLAPARGLPERALLALRPARFRLDCFFPAARATRCPVRSAAPAEVGAVS